MEIHGVFLVLGALAGAKVCFFRCRIFFFGVYSHSFLLQLWFLCLLLFLCFFKIHFYMRLGVSFPTSCARATSHFSPLVLSGQIRLISAAVVPVFCSSHQEAASSACWWLFHGGVTPPALRAAMLLAAACELGAVQSGIPEAGDCPLHLSRDGVQMCSADDAGDLSFEFRTIWKAGKINSCLFCHCLRRGGSVWWWQHPSSRLSLKNKGETAGCLG